MTTLIGHGRNEIQIITNIINFFRDPIVLFTALASLGAIVAAIAAVNANKPNSREKTDILKCEILNLLQSPAGLLAWVKCAERGESTPSQMAELLDILRSTQVIPNILRKGILKRIFKSRKYSKYKWRIYIIAAISELQQEGYESAKIGTTFLTPEDIDQWNYEQKTL